MSIGKKDIVGVEDTTSLEVESLVAVHVADCPPPSIGRVKEIKGSQIEVAWLKGAYNKAWQPWMMEDPQDKRKKKCHGLTGCPETLFYFLIFI